jgi:FixJ family two-component response regulator
MAEPTVFVVDDHPGVRKSLLALLDAAGLRAMAYASAAEFLAAYDADRPGCLVLDLRLRERSGLELQGELQRRRVTLPIIVVTGHPDVDSSIRALKSGAFDFLVKPVAPRLLLERIRDAIEVDRQARAVAVEREQVTRRLARLTAREREVLEHLVAGRTSKEIAAALRVSVRTVEGHRRFVLRKMKVSSAAQLVRAVLSAAAPRSTT